MLSVVLRLRSDELVKGHLAGEAEIVESRRRRLIRNADELIEFVAAEYDAGGARTPDQGRQSAGAPGIGRLMGVEHGRNEQEAHDGNSA